MGCFLLPDLGYILDYFLQTREWLYVCVTRLLGVYCDGVFLYLHLMANIQVYICGDHNRQFVLWLSQVDSRPIKLNPLQLLSCYYLSLPLSANVSLN